MNAQLTNHHSVPTPLAGESLLGLAEATKDLPRIGGKRPAISTLWRWATQGLRGVRLEYVRVGHRVCTSREALDRFFARLAQADDEQRAHRALTPAFNANRRDEVAQLNGELDAEGL